MFKNNSFYLLWQCHLFMTESVRDQLKRNKKTKFINELKSSNEHWYTHTQ